MEPLIRMVGITKTFPGVKALDNISFDILPGEVHVLIGENGAGKSTLMKILSGVYQPTSGQIICNGHEYSALTTKTSAEEGIAVVYQELSVINELSILENLFVGKLPTTKRLGIPVVDYKTMMEKAKIVLEQVGLRHDPNTLVGELAIPDKQLCEIAKALVSGAKVIVLDEPTTSLTTSEVERLHGLIRELKAQGCGIVYISHKMKELHQIGDRITVLKDGGYVGTYSVNEVTLDDLIRLMVGREIKGTYFADESAEELQKRPVIFEAKGITRADGACRDISFQLHEGEILGFAGLVGAGRTEAMEAIFGAVPKKAGQVFLRGKELKITEPYAAIKQGLGMLTEDRRKLGFAKNFTLDRNNGKDPVKYRMTIMMVKESQQWYIDPQSLKSYEAAETTDPASAATPEPTETPGTASNTILYYNPDGGTKYHSDPNCKSIHAKYLPLKGTFTYAQINDDTYKDLKPCNVCNAPLR